ncbi:hypothetical protein BKA65DRAFT_508859 [Rhexocercosporidium sp. MPI-PUGE-AT-0058]|nr:hypothetical protein BKA65DRAFT_508859 [Rhexocercosporidium sp. MPI-PUGE-AT-0058]
MPFTNPNRPPGGWMSVPKEQLPRHGGWLDTRVSLAERWDAMYLQENGNGPINAYMQYKSSVRPVDTYDEQESVSPAPPAYDQENVASARPVYNNNKQEYIASAQPVASAQPIYNTQEHVASTRQVDAYNKQESVAPARPAHKPYVASARQVYSYKKQEYTASAHPVDAYNKQEYVSSAHPVYNTQERVASAHSVDAYNNEEYVASARPVHAYSLEGYHYVPPVRRNRTRFLKEYPPYIKRWLASTSPSISPSISSSASLEAADEHRVEEQQYVEEKQYAEEQHAEEQRVEEEERVEDHQVDVQQYVEEEHNDTEMSGWDVNDEFTESSLTTSPRLKIRHIRNDEQREVLRQLSRVLSQSPAPKPVIREIETSKSPERQSPTPKPVIREIESSKTLEKETTSEETKIQNPATFLEPSPTSTPDPIVDPITPAVIIPKPRAEDMALEDSTLDAFESAHEQPLTAPTTFEQYFAMEVAERERLIDEAVRARMNNRLDHTKHGIRDARKGIGRLDELFSSIPSAPLAPVAPTISEGTKAAEVTPGPKPINESASNNTFIELKLKVKRPEWCQFWTANPEPQTRGRFASFGSRNWKFTWLGLILTIFSAWYLTESVMCGIYCHPTTSSTNTWQPSDPFFPYAIPTKLDQWTGKVVSGTARVIRLQVVDFLDPEGARYEIHSRNAHMGARDWWQGRSGPVGYRPYKDMDVGIESDYET